MKSALFFIPRANHQTTSLTAQERATYGRILYMCFFCICCVSLCEYAMCVCKFAVRHASLRDYAIWVKMRVNLLAVVVYVSFYSVL